MPTNDAFSLFKHFNPGQFLPARAARIEAGDFSVPSFDAAIARGERALDAAAAARMPV